MTDEFRLLAQGVVEYAIFMVDVDGRVTGWNPGAERITGYRADEIIGEHISRFYPPDAAADGRPEADLAVAAADGRHVVEGWRVRRGGERFWAHVVTTPLRDEDGALLGFGKVVRDLSAQADGDGGHADLRRTFAHLVRAQETERRRIAWDVHDDSIQSMIAASMRLQVLIGQQPESARQALLDLDASIQAAVRRAARARRPFAAADARRQRFGRFTARLSRRGGDRLGIGLHLAARTHRGTVAGSGGERVQARAGKQCRGVVDRTAEWSADTNIG